MSGFEDLAKWMEGFKSELDESSYQIILTRLTGNHFKTRTQLKLLFTKEIDIMFGAEELPLGAKALLLYQLEKLRNESPLPLGRKQKRRNESGCSTSVGIRECDDEDEDELYTYLQQPPPTARKVS